MVNEYSEKMYWKIRQLVLDHDDANDIMQNTFLKAWNNLDSFRNDSKLSTWLYRIAINESLDFIRKQKQNVSLDDNSNISNDVVKLMADDYFDGDEVHARLLAAVSELPETQRMVFNMKYFEDMKYSEISEILNTSEGALKASYHIAVKKISDFFHKSD